MKRFTRTFVVLAVCAGFTACESSEPGEELTGIDKILDDLDGLSFDDFLAQSSEQMLRRSPETITDYGIADLLGVGNDQLDNISDEYIKGTFYLNAGILELLRDYDRASLDADQQLSYDVYEFHLADRASREEFMYYSYTATFYGTAVHNQLELFLTDIHPVFSRQDAEDYISRLDQVDTKFEQLQEGLDLREERGIIPPQRILQWTLYFMESMANATATSNSYYTSFEERLSAVDELSQADKQDLLERAEQAIQESVLPAYSALYDYIDELQAKAPSDVGYWQYDRGDEYYSYCLSHHTTTGLTADQIHQTGLDELERIHAEMRVLFDRLSYPQDESLVQLYERVALDGGSVSGDEIKATYEAIIEEAYLHLDEAFDLLPTTPVIVIGDVVGGFYVSPSLDGTRPGAFYANVSGTEELFGMPTLTYHEAVPGHHLQIALAMELDLPIVRKLISFTAYAEGWALYAEKLAEELGWYDNDIYGNLGRLQAEAFRAARLVVDTGIHSKRWSFEQAVQFMIDNSAFDTLSVQWEVSRYVVWPGQATSYKTGMLKMLELRQYARDQQGDQFDLKQFHNTVLTAGSIPLPVLEQVVHDAY